jgi:hypothetical protein
LVPDVLKGDGWHFEKELDAIDEGQGKMQVFTMSKDGVYYEFLYHPKISYATIYRTYDKEQPVSERLFLFRGTLLDTQDYKTIMRLCEIPS